MPRRKLRKAEIRLTILLAVVSAAPALAQSGANWPVYGGDLGATKYSTLTDINRDNVAKLTPLWEWPTGGCTNGTLTFVALTLRSAEEIARGLRT